MKSQNFHWRKTFILFTVSCLSFSLISPAFAAAVKPDFLFIGTYTSGSSLGIYLDKMDTATGGLSQVCTSPSGKASNPSYLAVHPNKKWLYAVSEQTPGSVNAFSFDTIKKQMAFLNSVSSHGDGPAYISIDNSGRYVLVANYNSGSVAVFPINTDGSLGAACSFDQHSGSGPVSGRQDSAHAHMVMQASNGFVYCTDLGDDKIYIYNLDTATGAIHDAGNDASAEAGVGPRHMAFHSTKPWVYVSCELGGVVEAYTVNNSTGALTRFQSISTLPKGDTAAAVSADIHITPDGKFLYASNRGANNNIAMFTIDQTTGNLTLQGNQTTHGNTPRNFVIDPTGTFLLVANQDGSNIVTFKIGPSTGLLVETGIQTTVPNPACLKFLYVNEDNTAARNPLSPFRHNGNPLQMKMRASASGVVLTYSIRSSSFVQLSMFTVTGKRVASLAQQERSPGEYSVTIGAEGTIPDGLYVCRLQAGNYEQSTLLRVAK